MDGKLRRHFHYGSRYFSDECIRRLIFYGQTQQNSVDVRAYCELNSEVSACKQLLFVNSYSPTIRYNPSVGRLVGQSVSRSVGQSVRKNSLE